MSRTELERADLAAVQALDRMDDTCLSFANHGEDPKGFARMLARIVIESDRHGLDEISIRFFQGWRAAEISGICLNESGIEVVLADQQTELIP